MSSSISPSAKALLLVKSQTTLPFARGAAELLWGAEAIENARREAAASGSAGRAKHFEMRARSVDEAVRDWGGTRILEIASGLSFRGLALAASRDVHYLDTDLAEIAEIKSGLVSQLHPGPLTGSYRVQTLDALDADAFRAAVDSLPPGAIAIVHEGLLMYLDDAQKSALARSVRATLRARGGVWITADVYVRSVLRVYRDERTQRFLDAHRVEENKFADFGAAATFFDAQGFVVAKKLRPPDDPWPVRETWVLEART